MDRISTRTPPSIRREYMFNQEVCCFTRSGPEYIRRGINCEEVQSMWTAPVTKVGEREDKDKAT